MFDDIAEPTQHLTDPAGRSTEILGQPFSNIGVGLDWLSPSHIVSSFVTQTTGWDIYGDAAKAFTGDWETVWRCAGAFRNLASATHALGTNVSHGNMELDESWDGNASDAAYRYYAILGTAISLQRMGLTELADSYEKAAEGTYRLAESVSGLLKDITDSALIAIAASAAGTATIETGVGFATGWGIAAYEVYKISEMSGRARELIGAASALVGGVVGLMQSAAGSTGPLAAHALPQAPYRHPGTAQS